MLKVHRHECVPKYSKNTLYNTTLLVLYCHYVVGCCRNLGAEVVYALGVVGVDGVIPRRG